MPEEDMKLIGTIGYAMPLSKLETVIQPSLVAHARERGIHLIQVHIDEPLVEQGPFDCLVHKVYGDDWSAQLADFKAKYPTTVIIDSLADIEQLNNRVSMLELVNHLPVSVEQSDTEAYSIGIPKQVEIVANHDAPESLLTIDELTFPVIAKPLSAKSHEMSLVFSLNGLKKVKPPIVLQEFVNHGGVLFKVYVAGNHVKCVKKRSLPDFHAKCEDHEDIMSISQISGFAAGEEDAFIKEVEMPSMKFIHSMAKGLREASKLHLFNFDMIRDTREGSRYLIVDINYFPGYAKVPGFETMLTDFFWDVINTRMKVMRLPLIMWVVEKMKETKQGVAQRLQT
ncbi:inositol-tetrakisphosphate 1-kinase 1-like [Chenopodium quinoa]|uniref:Inositol-tetrakisphosphate 1-kinase n=1 Tax=Chenopodium quinoa TaxID=63459 RepID=A0A803M6P0_CHEQI|nr:inositol-tetrakisphosphate 1-kinase 1-like [Chenopodium quinoa]